MADDTLKVIMAIGIGAGGLYLINKKTNWLGSTTIKTATVDITPLATTTTTDSSNNSKNDNDPESSDNKTTYLLADSPSKEFYNTAFGEDSIVTQSYNVLYDITPAGAIMKIYDFFVSKDQKDKFVADLTDQAGTNLIKI